MKKENLKIIIRRLGLIVLLLLLGIDLTFAEDGLKVTSIWGVLILVTICIIIGVLSEIIEPIPLIDPKVVNEYPWEKK